MKIQLAIGDENIESVKKFLEEHGIETDDESEFVLTQRDMYVGHLSLKNEETGEKEIVPVDNIVTVESFGHTVEVFTMKRKYKSTERLYQMNSILNPKQFIRTSNSVIVNRKMIKTISPTLSMKFILLLKDGRKTDVTRGFYNNFKESMRI